MLLSTLEALRILGSAANHIGYRYSVKLGPLGNLAADNDALRILTNAASQVTKEEN